MAYYEKLADNFVDIFPDKITSVGDIAKVQYYPNNKITEEEVLPFVMFLDEDSKLRYVRKSYVDKYAQHAKFVLKYADILDSFKPKLIDWSGVVAKLKKTLNRSGGSVDSRAGFVMRNRYLVKAYFTFGQRTVAPGTAHVFQTLNVPLLFFLLEEKYKSPDDHRVTLKERFLPHGQTHFYDRRILEPNKIYRIPPGTTYFVFSTQKNLFAVDIIPAQNTVLNFVDPVAVRVTKLAGWCGGVDDSRSSGCGDIYSIPPPSPFIGASEVDRSNYDIEHQQQQQQQQQQQLQQLSFEGQPDTYSWIFNPNYGFLCPPAPPLHPPPPPPPSSSSSSSTPPQLLQDASSHESSSSEMVSREQQQQQQHQQQQSDREGGEVNEEEESSDETPVPECHPGPHIFEKNIIITNPEFVERYQNVFKFFEYGKPEIKYLTKKQLKYRLRKKTKVLPFDLSTRKKTLEDVGAVIDDMVSNLKKDSFGEACVDNTIAKLLSS